MGNSAGNCVDVLLGQRIAHRQARERALLRDPAHPDRVLDRPRLLIRHEVQVVLAADDGVDSEVVRGREPMIEAHLLAAHLQPSFEAAVVEERQHQRLLHLVGELAGEEDPGNMRLAQFDPLRAMGVEARIEHRRDDLA